jgi:hypothetical protein
MKELSKRRNDEGSQERLWPELFWCTQQQIKLNGTKQKLRDEDD